MIMTNKRIINQRQDLSYSINNQRLIEMIIAMPSSQTTLDARRLTSKIKHQLLLDLNELNSAQTEND